MYIVVIALKCHRLSVCYYNYVSYIHVIIMIMTIFIMIMTIFIMIMTIFIMTMIIFCSPHNLVDNWSINSCSWVKASLPLSSASVWNSCFTTSSTHDTSSTTSVSQIDSPLDNLSTMAEQTCPTDEEEKHFCTDNPWSCKTSEEVKHLLPCIQKHENNYSAT